MIKRVVITNHRGESMEYAIEGVQADENSSGLLITSIDGLGPGKATVNSTEIPTSDGDVVNSVRLSGKNIVIKGKFLAASSIEDARLLSYKYFPIKQKINFYVETDNRTASIDGYVESNEPVVFENGCGCQISIKCEKAYFDGKITTTEFIDGNRSAVIPYSGDINTGVQLEFELHPDSAVDSLNATSIDVLKENEKMFGLNMRKLNKFVPNSAGEGVINRQIFILNSNNYKRIYTLPESFLSDDDRWFEYESVIHNGALHLFRIGTHIQTRKHIAIDLNTNVGTVLPDVDGVITLGEVFFVAELNGTIYVLAANSIYENGRVPDGNPNNPYKIFKYDDANNRWVFVLDIDGETYLYAGNYNNKVNRHTIKTVVREEGPSIEVFVTAYYDGSSVNSYYSIHWTLVESDDGLRISSYTNLNEDFPELFPNENHKYFDFRDASLVIYNDTIHIFGGLNSDYGETNRNNHYIYHFAGDTISQEAILPMSVLSSSTFSVCNDTVYYIEWATGHSVMDVSSYDMRSNTVTYHYYIEYQILGIQAFSYGEYVYVTSCWSSSGDAYHEDPNNVKMIENDRVVINTNRGKRSASLIRNGVKYNILNVLDKNPKWIELQSGDNLLAYSSVGDNYKLRLSVTVTEQYEGV